MILAIQGRMMPRKPKRESPHSTNILDYPSSMSGFERESLAAEAKLKAERQKKKQPKPEKK